MLEERKVQRAKISLMRNPKFALLSGVLMVGKTSVDDDTPTARTNGRDEFYGRAFVKELDDAELAFVIAHEAAHKMYKGSCPPCLAFTAPPCFTRLRLESATPWLYLRTMISSVCQWDPPPCSEYTHCNYL